MNETDLQTLVGGSLISVGLLQAVLYGVFELWLMAIFGLCQTGLGMLYLWAKGVLPVATTVDHSLES